MLFVLALQQTDHLAIFRPILLHDILSGRLLFLVLILTRRSFLLYRLLRLLLAFYLLDLLVLYMSFYFFLEFILLYLEKDIFLFEQILIHSCCAVPHFVVDLLAAVNRMDSSGIEPESSDCKSDVLPLYYEPYNLAS